MSLQFFDYFYPIIITDVKPGKTFFLERQTLWGKQSGMLNCIIWVCFCKSRDDLWWHICYGRELSVRNGVFTWSTPFPPSFSKLIRFENKEIIPVKMRKQPKALSPNYLFQGNLRIPLALEERNNIKDPWSYCCGEKVQKSVLCCLKLTIQGNIHYRDSLSRKVFAKQWSESSVHTLPRVKFEEQIYTAPTISDLQCMLYKFSYGVWCVSFPKLNCNITNPTFSTGIKAQSESSGIYWSISNKLDISKTVRGIHSIRASITAVPAQQIPCKNQIQKDKLISKILFLFPFTLKDQY